MIATCDRSTFRRISQDTNKFVRFANGLMNESNSLVASVMEKLPEIRTTQLQMRDAAQWGALSESQRNQITDRCVRSVISPFPRRPIQMLDWDHGFARLVVDHNVMHASFLR